MKIEGIVETKLVGSTECEVEVVSSDEIMVRASGLILKLSVGRETKAEIVKLLNKERSDEKAA